MRCEHVQIPGAGTAIVCGRGRGRQERCACGRPAELLCDYPLRGKRAGKTCDRPLCRACAVRQGACPDGEITDYCPAHARLGGPLGGVR